MKWWERGPTIPLGTSRFLFFGSRTLRITPQQARAHMHVLGKTGSGKSYFLAGLFLAMHDAGMPATLIDPHGDLAEMVLAYLIQRGTFQDPKAYDRLVYLDLPALTGTCRLTTCSSPTTITPWPSSLLRPVDVRGRSWQPVRPRLRTSSSTQ